MRNRGWKVGCLSALAAMSVSFVACVDAQGADSDAERATVDVSKRRVVIMVWDGLRYDLVDEQATPHLAALRQSGVHFPDQHATFPTFTMMNAASFATGCFPDKTGFYGNTLWTQADIKGKNAENRDVDLFQPIHTEDFAILDRLDEHFDNELLMVGTLFQAAQKKGLVTFAGGKTGSAYLQDRKRGGFFLDEKFASPKEFAEELQAAGHKLPKATEEAYEHFELSEENGDPTKAGAKVFLEDGVTPDGTDTSGSPYVAANEYLMTTYLDYVLPKKDPDLSVVWLRNPDKTQHDYGVGSPNATAGLAHQDKMLALLQAKLKELGIDTQTDILVVADHGHSNVSGPFELFPLRAVAEKKVAGIDANGQSVSGEVRLADLLVRAGFKAFDGSGCTFDPVLSGIKADGTTVYPTKVDDDGTVCGKAGQKYTTPAYKLPHRGQAGGVLADAPAERLLPEGSIVIAPNGGSEYLYFPDHDPKQVAEVVRFLQSRTEFGAIFVHSRYGDVKGTLSLDKIRVESKGTRTPDIIASYAYDENARINGKVGIEYSSAFNTRGMHGSFSPVDVHNTLVAFGPSFRRGFLDPFPSGNVDVAPTVANILGLALPDAEGRVLTEALASCESDKACSAGAFDVQKRSIASPSAADKLVMKLPTDPDGKDIDPSATSYRIVVETKVLTDADGRSFTYFDRAQAVREGAGKK